MKFSPFFKITVETVEYVWRNTFQIVTTYNGNSFKNLEHPEASNAARFVSRLRRKTRLMQNIQHDKEMSIRTLRIQHFKSLFGQQLWCSMFQLLRKKRSSDEVEVMNLIVAHTQISNNIKFNTFSSKNGFQVKAPNVEGRWERTHFWTQNFRRIFVRISHIPYCNKTFNDIAYNDKIHN